MGVSTYNEVEKDKSNGKEIEEVSYDEQDEEEAINEKLVKEAQTILKEDWKINGNDYSERHYRDIIDEGCPYTCWRYIIHRGFNVRKAVELMKASLRWRKENRADECFNSEFPKEFWLHSPLVRSGTAKSGREDVFYLVGKYYRPPKAILRPHMTAFIINYMHQWEKCNRFNLRKGVVVFDCADCGYSNTDLELAYWLFNIKDYFPARLHSIYVVGIPYILKPFVQFLISWLPLNWRNLIKCGTFEELVIEDIGFENVPPEVGGTAIKGYLAPIESPWLAETPVYSTGELQKALEEVLWKYVPEERWKQMRTQQIEFETDIRSKEEANY